MGGRHQGCGWIRAELSHDRRYRSEGLQTLWHAAGQRRRLLRRRPDKKTKLILVYPMTTGRNFDEVLRVVDSLQLTAKHRVATPANWKQGEDVILTGAVTDDEAKKLYPDGWKTLKPYMRVVPQPRQ